MPQVVGPIFTWIGNVASAIFGGGAAGTGATVGTGAAGSSGAITATQIAAAYGAMTPGTIANAVGVSSAVGSLGNVALNLAISTALSVAFKPNISSSSGAPLDFKADKTAPAPFVVGRTATGGTSVFAEVFGGDTAKFLRFIVALSICGPIQGVESFSSNDNLLTFSGSSGRNAVGYYHDFMFQDTKLGAQPETAHFVSIAPWTSPAPPTWSTDHKLSGIASAQWILRYNNRIYSTGVPSPRWVLTGPKVYDPRKDSTYPGGSGPQRYSDPTTWSYAGNGNPYLQALTWCLGHKSNGKVAIGAGIPWEGIDVGKFVEGANVCDANGWTCGGVVYTSDNKWTVLETMLRAGGGRPMQVGAKVSCTVTTPRVSIATLTAEDVEGEVTMSAYPGRRSRFNTVRARYRDESLDWEFVQAQPVSIAPALAEDGETRTHEVDFPLVQDLDQACQLGAYDVLHSREMAPVTVPVLPCWRGLEPDDCFTLSDPVFGGAYKLLITQRELDPQNASYLLTCRGETDGKHSTALGVVGTAPAPVPPPSSGTGTIDPPEFGEFSADGLAVLP